MNIGYTMAFGHVRMAAQEQMSDAARTISLLRTRIGTQRFIVSGRKTDQSFFSGELKFILWDKQRIVITNDDEDFTLNIADIMEIRHNQLHHERPADIETAAA